MTKRPRYLLIRALMRSIISASLPAPSCRRTFRGRKRAGMLSILDGHIDPVQSAIFIALR